MSTEPLGLDDDLRQWIESETGSPVVGATRTATGGSRVTWLVDLENDVEPTSVVVRCEGEGSFTGTELTLMREAQVFRALADTRVPVPEVHAVRADGSAVLLERLDGTDDLSGFSHEERGAILDEFAAALVQLHRLDVEELELPDFAVPQTAEDHARLDLGMWQRLAARCASLDPLIEYCGAWLISHAPGTVTSTAFVQGDTGPGNFMATAHGLSGLIDMEFAHIGDPMDDLAWVWMRLRDFAPPEHFFESYVRHGGVPIDLTAVAYYRLAVDYRCAVTTSLAIERGQGARGWAPYVLQTQRFLDGIAARIAELANVEMPAVEVRDHEPTERTPMFGRLESGLRRAARSLREFDPESATSARNEQILVHYLRAYDQIGEVLAKEDAADRCSVLGTDADEPGGLRSHAAAAGGRGDLELLAYFLRRQRRNRQMWSTLLER